MKPGDLFFFYGLLKQGATGMPKHIDLETGGAFLSPAFVRGDLYDLGGFPGIIAGEGLVQGILYRLDDMQLIAPLDEFEDVIHEDPEASLYRRVRREVLNENGENTGEKAWVYWYNRPVDAFAKIADGNWPLDKGKAR